MAKLTEALVRDLEPPTDGERTEWDTVIRGLGIRLRPGGKKAFILKFRTEDGAQRKMTLGAWPVLSVDDARRKAKGALGAASEGRDPATEKQERKAAPTVDDLARDYLDHAAVTKRPATVRNDRDMFTRAILPALGGMKVVAVTRKNVETLHHSLRDKPYMANRVLSLLSHAFNTAKGWGWCTDNPVQGVKRYQEQKRDRWLQPDEVAKVWAVLDTHPNRRAACAMKLLLLTGARRSEALTATWDQFDLERGVWTKPSHATKQKRTEHVPLSPYALALLTEMKEKAAPESPFLFPGDADEKPYQEPKRFWEVVTMRATVALWAAAPDTPAGRIVAEIQAKRKAAGVDRAPTYDEVVERAAQKEVKLPAGLTDVRIHDLRHTFVSMLVSSGVPLYVAGRLAGHTQIATTQRYAHLADDPLRQATSRLGAMVQGIVTGQSAEVVPLPKTGRG